MLLAELLKYSDKKLSHTKELERALAKVAKVADEINERKRAVSYNVLQCMEIPDALREQHVFKGGVYSCPLAWKAFWSTRDDLRCCVIWECSKLELDFAREKNEHDIAMRHEYTDLFPITSLPPYTRFFWEGGVDPSCDSFHSMLL